MKYFYQVMIIVLILTSLVSLSIIIASCFFVVGSLYMWIILLTLSVSCLFGYVKLNRC